MNSEALVKLNIKCLAAIVGAVLALVSVLAWHHTEIAIITGLLQLGSSTTGSLGSLLSNNGGSFSAKAGGTVTVDNAPDEPSTHA